MIPLVLSLSPRPEGNSDSAAEHFARSLAGPSTFLRLRDHVVAPCTGCGACAKSGRCVFADGDHAEGLFASLDAAPMVMLAAPVYFYHLPAQAKAWIDRAQSRYLSGRFGQGIIRPAYIVLVAGRTRGVHLFAGIMPTLRYFLQVFDFSIQGTVHLRGLDGPRDLLANEKALEAVAALARSSGW
ncbi:MAG: flavodoxin family protein [Desulfovibrionales bacterium]|nr:flavodoxin family protein [Desulfovibrionales bacterium]